MNPFFTKLKAQAEDNPILVVGVGAAVATSAAKLIDALGGVMSKRAYAKKMNTSTKKK